MEGGPVGFFGIGRLQDVRGRIIIRGLIITGMDVRLFGQAGIIVGLCHITGTGQHQMDIIILTCAHRH